MLFYLKKIIIENFDGLSLMFFKWIKINPCSVV